MWDTQRKATGSLYVNQNISKKTNKQRKHTHTHPTPHTHKQKQTKNKNKQKKENKQTHTHTHTPHPHTQRWKQTQNKTVFTLFVALTCLTKQWIYIHIAWKSCWPIISILSCNWYSSTTLYNVKQYTCKFKFRIDSWLSLIERREHNVARYHQLFKRKID